MIAIMARRPLTNNAFNFAFIWLMLLCCAKVKPVYSTRLQQAPIWS